MVEGLNEGERVILCEKQKTNFKISRYSVPLLSLSGITKTLQTGVISAHVLRGISLKFKENSSPLWDHRDQGNRPL